MPLTHLQRSARAALAALALGLLAACATDTIPAPASPASSAQQVTPQATAEPHRQDFEQLERAFSARLGVYAVDTGTGREIAYHADDRFAYASTHKAFTAGAVLQQVPIGMLDRPVTYGKSDLVPDSPITAKHLGTGTATSMPLRAVIDAAVRYSDNVAGNLLFRELGGPGGFASIMRGMGDTTSHVDRIEPDLSRTAPGDVRDTSTPRAMAGILRSFTLGTALTPDKRAILTDMLRTNTTGDELIRSGVPAGWQVGDKTGTANYGTRNDIAIIWPPQRPPIILTILSDRQTQDAQHDNKLIAQAAAAALKALG